MGRTAAPDWAQRRTAGRELCIWLLILLAVVIVLAVAISVSWVMGRWIHQINI